MLAWHIAVCRPLQETRAAIELVNQDFRVYLPILDSKPMFPRYIFVQFDREYDDWGKIKSTRGCVDLIKNGFQPSIVPQDAMDAIMAFKPPVEPVDGETQYTEGQMVQIISGPFQGFQGLFQRDAKGRTAALLEVMGRRIELPKNSIRAA